MESIRGTDSLKNRKTNERKASNRRLRFSLVSFWTFSCPTRDFLTFNCLCESPFRNQWCHFDDVHASAVALRQNETNNCLFYRLNVFDVWCSFIALSVLSLRSVMTRCRTGPTRKTNERKASNRHSATTSPFFYPPIQEKKSKAFYSQSAFSFATVSFFFISVPIFFPACTQRFPHL